MELPYQCLDFKTGVHETLVPPDVVAMMASTIPIYYEAFLDG